MIWTILWMTISMDGTPNVQRMGDYTSMYECFYALDDVKNYIGWQSTNYQIVNSGLMCIQTLYEGDYEQHRILDPIKPDS